MPPGQRWVLLGGQSPGHLRADCHRWALPRAALREEVSHLERSPLPCGSGWPPARQQLCPQETRPVRKDGKPTPAGRFPALRGPGCQAPARPLWPPLASRFPSAPAGHQPLPSPHWHLVGPAPPSALLAPAASPVLDPGEPGGMSQPQQPPPAPSLNPPGVQQEGRGQGLLPLLESHLEASLGSVAPRGPCPPHSCRLLPFLQVFAGAGQRPGPRASTSRRSW